MTYPQQGWGQAPQPQYGQAPQQYQQAQPQYAPQPQPQQGWGQPQQAPQPQYAPAYGQQPPGPQQGWGQPQQPQQPLAQGSVDDFLHQPSSGYGPALSWKSKQMGATLAGRVARPIQDGDIQQQTAPNGGPPLFYRDGRPQLVMKVPVDVEPSAEHPEGKAQWYVQGQTRDELARAMKAAGAPEGPPETGAVIWVTWVSQRPNQFGGQSKQYAVQYQRPDGSAPAPQQVQQPAAQPAQAPPQYQPPPAQYQPQQPPAPAAAAQPPGQYQPAQQPAPAQGQQVPNPFGGAPLPLGQDNAALLASLTGQQQAVG